GEVHDGVGPLGPDQLEAARVVLGDVDALEPDGPARYLPPRHDALAHGPDRAVPPGRALVVVGPCRLVVEDDRGLACPAQVQAGGPAAEAVTTEYEVLHSPSRRAWALRLRRAARCPRLAANASFGSCGQGAQQEPPAAPHEAAPVAYRAGAPIRRR